VGRILRVSGQRSARSGSLELVAPDRMRNGAGQAHCLRCVQWLGHYATSQKVAGSRADKVNFFNLCDPSGRTRSSGYSASDSNEYQKLKKSEVKLSP
jgi:hypothetical protein